jgi:hypothetical protein
MTEFKVGLVVCSVGVEISVVFFVCLLPIKKSKVERVRFF